VVAHKSANSAERVAQAPEYHADSRYWYFEHTDTTSAGIEIGHDSIQFLHSGEAVQSPDSALLTEIKGGTRWVRIDTTTAKRGDHLAPGDTLFTIHLTFDMTGEQGAIAAAGDVVIAMDAQSSGLPPGYYTQCDWDCDLAATGDSIALNLIDDRCPKSGEIWYAGFYAMTCPLPEPSFSGTWDARGTFSDGVLTWYIENEVYYWESKGYCFWHFQY
jgi:hypothetical protein